MLGIYCAFKIFINMRKRDKLKVITEANLRLESMYLKSKGLIKENDDLEWAQDMSNDVNKSYEFLRDMSPEELENISFYNVEDREDGDTDYFSITSVIEEDDSILLYISVVDEDGEEDLRDEPMELDELIMHLDDGTLALIENY